MNRRHVPLHPFFVGAMFVFMGYRDMRPHASLGEFLGCLFATLVLIYALYRGLKLMVKEPYKASILTTVCVFFFCFFREMRAITDVFLLNLPHGETLARIHYIFPLLILLWLALIVLVLRTRKDLLPLKNYLNIATGLMLAVTILQIVLHPVARPQTDPGKAKTASSPLIAPAQPPDIYYILTDGHTSAESLEQFWGYDESDFVRHLNDNNFHVVKNALGNYSYTPFSMSASLNMNYVSPPGKNVSEFAKLVEVYESARHAEAPAQLQSIGYQIINLSFFPLLDQPKHYRYPFLDVGTFPRLLLEKSAWHFYQVFWGQRKVGPINLEILSTVQKISATRGQRPRFIYAHLIMPHSPYLFDRDGKPIVRGLGKEKRKEDYLGQLIYVDRLLTNTVSEIIKNSKTPPIIIVQGDHGFTHLPGAKERAEEEMTILNAYHLPRAEKDWVYNGITPVNSFRMIFNHYFGARYEYLPDRQNMLGYHGD